MRCRFPNLIVVLVLLTAWGSAPAIAQSCTGLCLQQVACPSGTATTSVSGTVYAPNGADPLPNVLVYVPNGAVAPMPSGVSCDIPASGSPLVWTTSNSDGTFVLPNMPVGTNIPLVVQTGKWRRQLVVPNVAQCVDTPLAAGQVRLPKNSNEGDIPRMAILTSSADVPECILRKIGIDDTEFTVPGGGGRINFYSGTGAIIAASPPTEAQLLGSLATLSQYDATILACQGSVLPTTQQEKDTLVSYANAGGRVLAAHEEYRFLYNQAPFSGTALWSVEQLNPVPQTAFVNTTFPGGQRLAQWLKTVNASVTPGEITLSTPLRKDQNGIVPPTQSWLTINNPLSVLQFSFDTPVGVAPAQQCGRIQYREMHSSPFSGSVVTFPAECTASPMTPDEKLFMFSLFDVTGFIQPALPLTVTYNANGATGGTVPVDANAYAAGATVTVLGNTGALIRANFTFGGWNTAPDGSGANYAATGSATFTLGATPVVLYARWLPVPCSLDVDGNAAVDPLTDGLLLMRAMFGLTGNAVTTGALGQGYTRGDWTAIRSFLNAKCGGNFGP